MKSKLYKVQLWFRLLHDLVLDQIELNNLFAWLFLYKNHVLFLNVAGSERMFSTFPDLFHFQQPCGDSQYNYSPYQLDDHPFV